MVAELWFYPNGSRILELSTKCAPSEAFQVSAESKAFLAERGVELSGQQQTKTRTALEYFSGSQAPSVELLTPASDAVPMLVQPFHSARRGGEVDDGRRDDLPSSSERSSRTPAPGARSKLGTTGNQTSRRGTS